MMMMTMRTNIVKRQIKVVKRKEGLKLYEPLNLLDPMAIKNVWDQSLSHKSKYKRKRIKR